MALPQINITKRRGGLGRRNPSLDMVSALVANGATVADWLVGTTYAIGDRVVYDGNYYRSLTAGNIGNQPDSSPNAWLAIGEVVALDTNFTFLSTLDAEDAGITAEYDAEHSVLVHYHIAEFFRMNPSGELWVRLATQTAVEIDDLVDLNNAHARKLLDDAEGRIRQIGIAWNPTDPDTFTYTYTTYSGSLPDVVLDAIYKAQALVDDQYAKKKPVQVILEGKGLDISGTITDLRDKAAAGEPVFNAPNVSVVVGSDPAITGYGSTAALGTAMGTISAAAVSQNIGELQSFNLTDAAASRFTDAQLSDGTAFADLTDTQKNTLNDRGYIFVTRLIGFDGHYWNDSPTCVELADDLAYIEANRTLDKAVRQVRLALLPQLKSRVPVDGTTGQIAREIVNSFEGICRTALDQMQSDGDISARDVYIDPAQNILTTGKIEVKISIVPVGIARTIEVSIGFETSVA